MTETDLVERIRRLWAGGALPRGTIGIGDDAAVLPVRRVRRGRGAGAPGSSLLVSTDLFLEGTHFDRRFVPAPFIGRKALAAAASDIGAMGGAPTACLLSLGAPPGRAGARRAEAVLAAFHEEAREIGIPLVGGDLSRSAAGLVLDVVVLGRPAGRAPILRSGARPRDLLFVTGPLGGSAAGLQMLRRGRRPWRVWPRGGARRADDPRASRHALETLAVLAHLRPRPPLAAGAAFGRSGRVRAMMDLSDGLALDLRRLCAASGTGARVVEELLPVHPAALGLLGPRKALVAALGGGEDYELLLAAPAASEARLRALARRAGSDLLRIGDVTSRRSGLLLHHEGRSRPLPRAGWDPFSRPPRLAGRG